MDYPSETNRFHEQQAALIGASYRRLFGRDLLAAGRSDEPFAKRLFFAPFAVLSHNTAADPVFNYANRTALELFEFSWDELTRMPSRLSAEPVNQTERAKLLAEVARNGCIGNYQGIRLAKSGRRFLIRNAAVWNLSDPDGVYRGQAACFQHWRFL